MWDELLPRALDIGGVVLIAVLLVWRIDVRMANVEKAMKQVCLQIGRLIAAMEK